MPEIVHDNSDNSPIKRTTKRGGVAAIAVLAACGLACSLPLLVGLGAASGLGAIFGGWQWFGIALVVGAAAIASWLFVRNRRAARARAARGATDADSCDCGTC